LPEILAENGRGRFQSPVRHPGIGVNVNWRREDFPADLGVTATSLHAEGGKEISRAGAAAGLFQELEKEYTRLSPGRVFRPAEGEWNRLS